MAGVERPLAQRPRSTTSKGRHAGKAGERESRAAGSGEAQHQSQRALVPPIALPRPTELVWAHALPIHEPTTPMPIHLELVSTNPANQCPRHGQHHTSPPDGPPPIDCCHPTRDTLYAQGADVPRRPSKSPALGPSAGLALRPQELLQTRPQEPPRPPHPPRRQLPPTDQLIHRGNEDMHSPHPKSSSRPWHSDSWRAGAGPLDRQYPLPLPCPHDDPPAWTTQRHLGTSSKTSSDDLGRLPANRNKPKTRRHGTVQHQASLAGSRRASNRQTSSRCNWGVHRPVHRFSESACTGPRPTVTPPPHRYMREDVQELDRGHRHTREDRL